MGKKRKVKQRMFVETTPEMAFEALTRASELREWFSDGAWTQVQPGGRYGVHWNQGYHAEGTFTKVEPPHRAVITWQGTGEPGASKVKFTVEDVEGGVEVKVVHKGFGSGEEWDAAVEQAERGWSVGLENLKSTLETGLDLRLTRQPFLGILPDLVTPERAERDGLAVEHGIWVLGTVEGSGARAAGLDQGDIIVALGGKETPAFAELGAALRACQVGDVVDVALVRGQEQEAVQITLGSRPQPEIPESAAALADRVAAQYEEANAELKAALEGAGEGEAGVQPAEGEWSAKQVLAHLSDGERGLHVLLINIAVNGWLDGGPVYPNQIPGRMNAILTVAPTLAQLLDRVLTDCAETVALLRGLPEATLAHKARFRRIVDIVSYGGDHTREHIAQIQAAIESARGV